MKRKRLLVGAICEADRDLYPSEKSKISRPASPVAPTVLFLLAFLSSLTYADYQAGLDAYNAGRYTIALDEWRAVVAHSPTEVNPAIYAETHYAIGMLYWLGQGVAKDYFEASKWIHEAAELGHAGAQAKLGFLYTEGIAVRQDYDTAFVWFSKAAKQGDVDGLYNLGVFYLNGWGTEQDKTMATQYLAAASAQGDMAAEETLRNLLPALPDGELDPGSSPGRLEDSHSGTGSESGMTDPEPPTRHSSTGLESRMTDPEPPTRHSALDPESPTRHSGLDPEPIFLSLSWILSQNPNHYTIQVIGLSSMPKLESLVEGYNHLSPFAVYTLQRNGSPLYLMVQGVYPDVGSARKAVSSFPVSIQKREDLWIRKFQRVQDLVNADNR